MSFTQKIIWRIKFIYSKIKERIVIPSYEEKRAIILDYKKKFNTNILIETGTFLGDTVEQFKNAFTKIISFELSEELAGKALKRFDNCAHIEIIQGDSGKLLSQFLTQLDEPCLFWLDGHYSSEFFIGDEYIKTAQGDRNTPIIEELKAILSHPVKAHVVLIDDARCFNGNDDYPTIDELKKLVSQFRKDLSVKVKRDIIRITSVA